MNLVWNEQQKEDKFGMMEPIDSGMRRIWLNEHQIELATAS